MIFYEEDVRKSIRKELIPKDVFKRLNNAFIALDTTGDLGLFDVRKLKSSENRVYYRLRKGKYQAIFYIEKSDYYVISIANREEVYPKWE